MPLTVHASYDPQGGPPSHPPGYDGPMASWTRRYREITLETSIEVVGEAASAVAPGPALDAMLADRKFQRWLEARPAKTWSGANLSLTSGGRGGSGIVPEAPSWEIDLFREIGVPRNWAIGFVDARTGDLVSVTYCDVPCDR